MPIHGGHRNVLDGTFKFIFDDIRESAPPDVAVAAHEVIAAAIELVSGDQQQKALKEIFFNKLFNKWMGEFDRCGITASLNEVLKIVFHPHPQNRTTSCSPYYSSLVPGSVVYSVRRGDILREEKEALTLKDGTVIPRSFIIERYRKSEPEQPDETAYLASEPEGLLSLTALGAITPREIFGYIRSLSECEISQIKEKSKKLAEIKLNTELLVKELLANPSPDDRDEIEETVNKLQEFVVTEPTLVEEILLRVGPHLNIRTDSLPKKTNENARFVSRVVGIVWDVSFDQEIQAMEKELADSKLREIAFTAEIQILKAKLENQKAIMIRQLWGEELEEKQLNEVEINKRWNTLITSEDLTRIIELCKNYHSREQIENAVRLIEELKISFSKLNAFALQSVLKLENQNEGTKRLRILREKIAARTKRRKIFDCLQKGDFEKANSIWATLPLVKEPNSAASEDKMHMANGSSKDCGHNYFNVNAKDEFGNPVIYYAIKNGNYLLAYKLAVTYDADTSQLDKFEFPRNTALDAAFKILPGREREHAWGEVIKNEIDHEIKTFIEMADAAKTWPDTRVAIDGIQRLGNKYKDHYFEYISVFHTFINHKFFSQPDKTELFKMFVREFLFQARNDAILLLQDFLDFRIANLAAVRVLFENLKQIALYNSIINVHLLSLVDELVTSLSGTKESSACKNLEAIKFKFVRIQAEDKFQSIVERHDRYVSARKKADSDWAAASKYSSNKHLENLQHFIKDLLASLELLPEHRKNCVAAFFKVEAENKADKVRLEGQLIQQRDQLTISNIRETADCIARYINAYQQTLTLHQGKKTGQSRYLAKLNIFLDSKSLPRENLVGEGILEAVQKAQVLAPRI